MSAFDRIREVGAVKDIASLGANLAYAHVLTALLELLPGGVAEKIARAMSEKIGGPPEIYADFISELEGAGLIERDGDIFKAAVLADAWREEQLVAFAEKAEKSEEALRAQIGRQLSDLFAAGAESVAVWGSNATGALAARAIESRGTRVTCFIESDAAKRGAPVEGKPVVSLDTALAERPLKPDAVVICSNAFKKEIESKIAGRLPVYFLFKNGIYDAAGPGADVPPLCLFTIPKSGTHLLFRALSLFPGVSFENRIYPPDTEINPRAIGPFIGFASSTKRGGFICEHSEWQPDLARSLDALGMKVITMLRDPRDILVSLYFFLVFKLKDHPYSRYLCEKFGGKDERIAALITGEGFNDPIFDTASSFFHLDGRNIAERMAPYLKWSGESCCYTARYETLVGASGGGSDEERRREIKNISDFIGAGLTERQIGFVAGNIYSKSSATFRAGKTGDWKNHLSDANIKAFKNCAGEMLIELSYEKDLDW